MPYYKEKEEEECRWKSVRSETGLRLTVTFNNTNDLLWVSFACRCVCACVCFLKLWSLIIKSRQTTKSETSALTECNKIKKKQLARSADVVETKKEFFL